MATTISINLSSLDGSNGFRVDRIEDYYGGVLLSNADDMNGDGFDDVAIGTAFVEYYGESYVVFGKASGSSAAIDLDALDGENGFRIKVGEALDDVLTDNRFKSVGDINGDGFDDVAIVQDFIEVNYDSHFRSSAYIVFGKFGDFNPNLDLFELNGSNGFRLEGNEPNIEISEAGDVNGDGVDDFIIGESTFGPNGVSSGSSYVVFGRTSGFETTVNFFNLDGSAGFRLDGVAARDFSGSSVGNAGDVNGDGFDDLIIGAPGADPNGESSGSSYIVFGKTSGFSAAMNLSGLDGSNGFRLDGVAAGDRSGLSVSTAGDMNGDGFDDVLVNGRFPVVVFGKAAGFDATMNISDLDGSNGFHLDGTGLSLVANTAGDMNGDGFDDLIIGAPGADPNGENSGSSYVMFGKASGFEAVIKLSALDSSNSIRLDGVAAGDLSGMHVSTAGDVNGDGFDDVLVNGRSSSYVVFGKDQFSGIVTYVGTSEDDIFTGTSAAESFEGGDGNDRMIGRGGADSFDGGAGNDYIRISDDTFQWVDGGTGTDTLGLAGSGFNLDLSSVIDDIQGIETISLYGVGDNMLTLTAQDVIDLSDETNTLKVKGNAGDSVVGLSSGWADGGVHGNLHTYTQGEAVLLIGVDVTTDFPMI